MTLRTYLLNQWDSIQNYSHLKALLSGKDPALSRVGVIEGHIYQVLYLRFESRGGYWSDTGLNALLHVLMAELNGTIAQFVSTSGREARKKISESVSTQQIKSRKRKADTPCVHGVFPVMKGPDCQTRKALIKIAHPERKKAS